MNILRQYSLPNCTLVLEGFDDGTGNAMQTLALLSNAECRFLTSRQSLNGGKVFFDHLVKAVSEYAQGVLSGMQHPLALEDNPGNGQLTIETLEPSKTHRLLWQQGEEGATDAIKSEVNLTTAELFDLTEAIDQFLADALTLPNFVLPLQPLHRRYSVPEQSFAERVTPPLIGASGLALSAFALFFVPVPETTRVEEALNSDSETIEEVTETSEATDSPENPDNISSLEVEDAIADPDVDTESELETDSELESDTDPDAESVVAEADLDELLNEVPEIDDALSLTIMQTYLSRTLNEAWEDRTENQEAAYRISIATDGAIVGYEAVDDTPEEAIDDTPLPALTYSSVDEAIAASEPVGQFKVVFNDQVLEISPWNGSIGEIDFDTSEIRGDALRELVTGVRSEITDALDGGTVNTNATLKYSVGVTDAGVIAFYVAENGAADAGVDKTPLPDLINPEAAGIIPNQSILPQEPLTQVNVVFKTNGVVEVSPWAGYR